MIHKLLELVFKMRLYNLIFLSLFQLKADAQFENHEWRFGNTSKGLSFNQFTNTPFITNDSHTPYFGGTGSTVVNPTTGNLLFYSDGGKVVDATHSIMPNGAGLFGPPATATSGYCCKVPGNCDQWYVFSVTTQTEASPIVVGNLYYSVVDMSLPGNGSIVTPLGDVVSGQKNILITTSISEAIEIIPKTNSHNYFMLVGRNNSSIDVYEIDPSGFTFLYNQVLGIMCTDMHRIRYSEASNKVAITSVVENQQLVCFDFDPVSGLCSSIIGVPGTPIGTSPLNWGGIFDAEFSPDGTKLYFSKVRGLSPSTGGKLYQYDFNLPANPAVLIYDLSTNSNVVARGLELGPDGRIYFMDNEGTGVLQFLSVISSPNLPGASCGFLLDNLNLGANLAPAINLFPSNYRRTNSIPQIPDSTLTYNCQFPPTITFSPLTGYADNESDNLSFTVNNVVGGTYNIVGSDLNFTPDPGFVGNPEIEIIYQDDFCFPLSDTFNITLTVVTGTGTLAMQDSLLACIGSAVQLDAGTGFTSYLWSTSEVTQTIDVVSSGMYSVETSDGTCTYQDSTFVQFNPPTTVSLGPDQLLCADSLELNIGTFTGIVNWSDGASGISNWVINSGQYSVIAENSSGCLSYDTIDVVINPLPVISLGADQQLCDGDQIYLTASGYNSVLWSDASTNDSLLVTSSGNYSVTVSNIFLCTATDEITITFNTPVQISLGPDVTLCNLDALLSAAGFGGSVTWSDGAVGNTNLVFNSGEYSVIGEDLNGCESFDTINVFLAPIPSLNLGADTLICPDDFYLVASGFSNVLWSTGETSDSIPVTQSGIYSVEVTNSYGCQASDQISIDIVDPSLIDLGPDIESCSQSEIILSTGLEYGAFQWSNGAQSAAITVLESGTYFVTQNVCGIEFTDSVKVEITMLEQTVYIPNAFTPDGNTLNPVFEVVFGDNAHVIFYELIIYNRWGQIVFQTTDPYDTWDGTGNNGLVQDGVYIYTVHVETDCNENPVWFKTGHVTVLK